MNKEALIRKLSDLEWEDFEVKEARAEIPRNSWETVSAFSNTNGGWLLFGIKQTGRDYEIQGVTNPEKIEQDFLNTLRGEKFNVFVPTRQEKYDIDNTIVLAFYIPVSKKKPVYYNTPANTFIRRGSSDQRATREEIDAMFRDQTFGTKTTEPAPGTSRADINDKSLSRYRDYMARFNPNVTYNLYNETEFLQKLRILDGEQCTYGGLLFLGKRDTIERFFPDFRIDLLEIPGTSYSDARVRYTFRLDEYENLWDYYFECLARLKSKVDVEYQLGNEGFAMDVSPGLAALREALVNMLMHADHFSPACPRIRIFTNHIEFYNPGGLPKPLNELRGKDISLPRNPVITKLFRMAKLAENAGYGLDNMEDNWKLYNQTSPAYDVDFDSVIVRFQLSRSVSPPFVKSVPEGDEYGKISQELLNDINEFETELHTKFDLTSLNSNDLLNFIETNYDTLLEYIRVKFGLSSEIVRRQFGENMTIKQITNYLRIIMLISINNSLPAEIMSEALNIPVRSLKRYIRKLTEKQIINREGSDKKGSWIIIR
jgi:ATP-dependent DNA helicase RecG